MSLDQSDADVRHVTGAIVSGEAIAFVGVARFGVSSKSNT
jgi:hypothetical protein